MLVALSQRAYWAVDWVASGLLVHAYTLVSVIWLSNFSVAPSAVRMSARRVVRAKHMMCPNLSLRKKVISSILNCTVCFVSFFISFDCVFPDTEQVIKCNCCEVHHGLVEGRCKAMSAFVD